MNLNVSFFLICTFCLYFMNSFNDKYYSEYERLLVKDNGKIFNKSDKNFYNIICSLNSDPGQLGNKLLRRATICKFAIKNLRYTNEDGYEDLYMDYHSFTQNPNCNFVEVSNPNKSEKANQAVVVCPLRPSFFPMDTDQESIQNSSLIAVFPKTFTKLIIFNPSLEPNGNIKHWELYKIIDQLNWAGYKKVSPQVFQVTVPDSYSKTQYMFNLLSTSAEHKKNSEESNDILNSVLIPNICKIVYRPGKYKDFIYVDKSTVTYKEPEIEEVTLFSEDPEKYVQFSTLVYKCYREIQTTPKTYVDDYRISAGPLTDSYMLLHKTKKVLKVIEFVIDLNINYIMLYDSY